MKTEEISKLYDELIAEFSDPDVSYFRLIQDAVGYSVSFGVDKFKKPVLRVQYDAALTHDIDSCRGYTVDFDMSSGKALIITSVKEEHDVFFIVVEDLTNIAEKGGTINDFADRLALWKEFFAKAKNGKLPYEAEMGLYGELSFIHEMISIFEYTDIVSFWDGPDGTPKDFNTPYGSVEVKAVSTKDRKHVCISSVEQLDDLPNGRLFLAVVELHDSPMDGVNLPDLIDIVKSEIHDDNLIALLDKKILKAGYRDEFSNLYTSKWEAVPSTTYEVLEGFPRLTRQMLHSGICKATYILDLSYCDNDFFISEQDVFRAITEGR